MSNNPLMKLVPGRECGECNACCRDFTIFEIRKPAGALCSHYDTACSNCKIYSQRPSPCRDFHCMWRFSLLELGDDWRPDRCGLVVLPEDQDIPEGFESFGYRFDLLGPLDTTTMPRALMWEPLIILLVCAVNLKIPVFLGVPGPAGYTARKLFLNNAMEQAAATHDHQGVVQVLYAAYLEAVSTPREKITFTDAA